MVGEDKKVHKIISPQIHCAPIIFFDLHSYYHYVPLF